MNEMYTLNTIDRPAVAFAWANSAKSGLSVLCYEGQNVCTDTDKAFTLQAGRPDQQHIPTLVYDARGNGDGDTAPTMTGHHNANSSDYTAILVEKHE